MKRILYIVGILFLQSCFSAPNPDFNFELVVKPVIIMKTEESVLGIFNIHAPSIPSKEAESSMLAEGSNRIKRQAEETASANPETTTTPSDTTPPAEGVATTTAPPVENVAISTVPPESVTSAAPNSEVTVAAAAPTSEVTITATPPTSEVMDTTTSAKDQPSASPPEVADAPTDGNIEIPTKIAETATMLPVPTIPKTAIDAPVISQNADAVQKAVSEAPDMAQNVETSGGFGMPDFGSLVSTLGKLAESGQQIASDVKNAVTDMIGQLSNGISGLVG